MPAIARLGDEHSHGGTIITAASRTVVEGQPVARIGDLIFCSRHLIQTIVQGSSRFSCEGNLVAYVGAQCSCGAVITTGGARTSCGV